MSNFSSKTMKSKLTEKIKNNTTSSSHSYYWGNTNIIPFSGKYTHVGQESGTDNPLNDVSGSTFQKSLLDGVPETTAEKRLENMRYAKKNK